MSNLRPDDSRIPISQPLPSIVIRLEQVVADSLAECGYSQVIPSLSSMGFEGNLKQLISSLICTDQTQLATTMAKDLRLAQYISRMTLFHLENQHNSGIPNFNHHIRLLCDEKLVETLCRSLMSIDTPISTEVTEIEIPECLNATLLESAAKLSMLSGVTWRVLEIAMSALEPVNPVSTEAVGLRISGLYCRLSTEGARRRLHNILNTHLSPDVNHENACVVIARQHPDRSFVETSGLFIPSKNIRPNQTISNLAHLESLRDFKDSVQCEPQVVSYRFPSTQASTTPKVVYSLERSVREEVRDLIAESLRIPIEDLVNGRAFDYELKLPSKAKAQQLKAILDTVIRAANPSLALSHIYSSGSTNAVLLPLLTFQDPRLLHLLATNSEIAQKLAEVLGSRQSKTSFNANIKIDSIDSYQFDGGRLVNYLCRALNQTGKKIDPKLFANLRPHLLGQKLSTRNFLALFYDDAFAGAFIENLVKVSAHSRDIPRLQEKDKEELVRVMRSELETVCNAYDDAAIASGYPLPKRTVAISNLLYEKTGIKFRPLDDLSIGISLPTEVTARCISELLTSALGVSVQTINLPNGQVGLHILEDTLSEDKIRAMTPNLGRGIESVFSMAYQIQFDLT